MKKKLGYATLAIVMAFSFHTIAEEKINQPDSEETEYGPPDSDEDHQAVGDSNEKHLKPLTAEERKKLEDTAPVWKPFDKAFKTCAPAGCEPVGVATLGNGQNPKSCINQGASLNIAGMICGKGKSQVLHKAINGGKFEKMIKCVSKQPGIAKMLYKTGMQPIEGFRQIALVSVGCNHDAKGKPTMY